MVVSATEGIAVDFTGRLSRTTLLETLTARIEEQIQSGVLPLGERMPSEGMLAEKYGVSRPLVREALAELRARGYVETRNGTGTFVRHPDAAHLGEVLLSHAALQSTRELNVDDLYGARSAIETAAARLAATEANDENLEELAHLLEEMEEHAQDPIAFTAADVGFHLAIARASGNALLPSMLAPLVRVIVHGVLESSSEPVAAAAGIRAHREILERLRARDTEGAAEAARLHLVESRGFFPESVPIQGLLLADPPA